MAAAAHTRSPFILSPSPGADVVCIVAMPLLALLILPFARIFSSASVWAVVMAFGAVGHHLPGFLRTYGDAALFRRFKWRFILAPPFLFAATLWFSLRDLHGMALITVVWSLWHGMMQHYGFLRIYDAKAGATAKWIARLDWWMSFAWFSSCLVYSPGETGSLLEALYATGFGALPHWLLPLLSKIVLAATATVTVAYLGGIYLARRRGMPMSPLKLLLLVGTSLFLVYARVVTRDHFLTAALFEVLHDVQYLAIVWAFNRRLVDQRQGGSRFARALFGAGAVRPAIYAGLCLAYGGIAWLAAPWEPVGELSRRVLLALLATSGLLHFYYDGFIWKVRRPETQAGLGLLDPRAAHQAPINTVPNSRAASLLTASYIVVPVLVLGAIEMRGHRQNALEMARSLVEATPENGSSHDALGSALLDEGQVEAALDSFRLSLALEPHHATARSHQAEALLRAGRFDEAARAARQALAENSTLAGAHLVLADVLVKTAPGDEAIAHYQAALAHGADDARAHNNLANALVAAHRAGEALAEYRLAVARAPGVAGIHLSLGIALANGGQTVAGIAELRVATRLAPDSAPAHSNLGAALARSGRRDEAISELQEALRIYASSASSSKNPNGLGDANEAANEAVTKSNLAALTSRR